jgi:septum formation protein
MNLPPVILASASPRRAELLQQLRLDFRVVPSDVPELHHAQFTARELAQLNAYRKARAVADRFPATLVLGADTLVYLGSRLFGKPADLAGARWMLHQLQGATHQVVTGVCFIHLRKHHWTVFAESTDVRFKALTSQQIDQYLASINPLDKAGAYAIQEGGEALVQEVSGSYSNVVGLPLERLEAELNAWSA